MQKTEKFFIFSWKELTVLGLLFLISVGFFFTLGLHYGKKLRPEQAVTEGTVPKLEESPENVPAKEALDEAAQHTEGATQDTIKSATQEELDKSGLKVDEPKAVDLPSEKTVGKKAIEKNVEEKAAPSSEATEADEEATVIHSGKYAIQLGSYPSKKEAQLKIKSLVKRNLHPEVRTAEVGGQTRYRVVLAGFKTHGAADQRGKELHAKHKIENFVVIKSE